MLSAIIHIDQDQVLIIFREKRNVKKNIIRRPNEQFSVEAYLDVTNFSQLYQVNVCWGVCWHR